jgi:hypothetical protein
VKSYDMKVPGIVLALDRERALLADLSENQLGG